MIFSPMIEELIQALRCLPGVGNKTAQRMALHLLDRNRDAAGRLATTLASAVKHIGRCTQCRILTEEQVCSICTNPARDQRVLCVVETPADVLAIEESGSFRGRYFVLLGHLSPIDGIGPDDIGIDQLLERLRSDGIAELILATNPTVEGEATAHFISQKAKALGVNVSRIAHGVPIGSELEYVDGRTLVHAFQGRKTL